MFKNKLAKLIATYFGSGFSKLCPGTVGSILTLPLWYVIILTVFKLQLKPYVWTPIVILVIFIAGYYSTKQYLKDTKKEDPSEVVIDEVVGQLLAFLLSFVFMLFITNKESLTFLTVDHKIFTCLYFFIFPIILFRIYDIKKPWIIGKIDSKMKNALGVMLDDVVGGVFAGLTNSVVMLVVLKVFG